MVFILHWILYVILGVSFIFLVYFRLISVFGRFMNKKWQKQDEKEQFGAISADAEKHGQQDGVAVPAMGVVVPPICQ